MCQHTFRNTTSFSFYEIDDGVLSHLPVRKGDYINISTYYRILLPTILPSTIETVLYLDGDMLVVDSISDLWNIDVAGKSAAVVPCIHYANPNEFIRLGLDKKEGYFNAGFMLINLKFWRENDIQNKTLRFLTDFPNRCKKHDQDALNYVLSDSLLYISTRYNFQRIMYEKDFAYPIKFKDDIEKNALTPAIIHYCDREKPWHKECFHPYTAVWRNVAKSINPRFRLRYKYTGTERIKYMVKQILRALGIKNKNFLDYYTVDFSQSAIY